MYDSGNVLTRMLQPGRACIADKILTFAPKGMDGFVFGTALKGFQTGASIRSGLSRTG